MNEYAQQIVDKSLSILIHFPWHWVAFASHMVLAILAAMHAMLYKRDPRASLGWVSVSLFIPFAGPVLYYMFGINRIQTQARKLRHRFKLHVGYERGSKSGQASVVHAALDPHQQTFVHVSDRVTARPLTAGNKLAMLSNGEQAYPAMLAAIENAKASVLLVTYIFTWDEIGKAFVNALTHACQRGIKVYVIIDGVGEWYSWPRTRWKLRRAGIVVERFLPPRLLPPSFSVNLRNHRKILVVDGKQGFTGGMNISARHMVESGNPNQTADLHFAVNGPVVRHLQNVFKEDWYFITGKRLDLPKPEYDTGGNVYCRCISDGPNEDLDKISLVLNGAISASRQSITIITPYFLPSREMIASLQAAALRGIAINIVLPEKSNLRFVDWATRNLLWELLMYEVKVQYQPLPFAHTKMFLVDDVYAHIGSANLDPRSLRLNFELNLEIVGAEAVAQLRGYADEILRRSSPINLQEIDGRRLPERVRDAMCWLFLPYL